MNPEIQKLFDTEWRPEDQLSDSRLAGQVEATLSGEDADGRFVIEVFVPAERPSFAFVTGALTAIERRVRLSVLLAFLEPVQIAQFNNINELLAEFREIPLRVTELTMSSIKVTIEGDADEVSLVLGRQKRPRAWRRKLMAMLAVIAGGITLVLSVGDFLGVPIHPLNPPTQQEVLEEANRVCGYLPDGTEITIKTGVVEIKVPCRGRLR